MRILSFAALALCASCARPEQTPSSDPGAQPCATAADCKGMLPHLCRACADGGSECAQWTCVSGSCATTLCGEPQNQPR